ncbi:MAG TPA: hypothetical protein VFK57_24945 [Vicinamibacterales bacterium]|nr:hypothetical protein [Vicinamibacterales bacterium]
MRIENVRCPVLGAHVTRVVDFEGLVDHVICPEYQRADGSCRLKRAAGSGGPLGRLLQRVGEDIAAEHVVTCSLR